MRSSPAERSPAQLRRAWDAPVMTETPIATGTKAATNDRQPASPPPPPASPSTKLGFSFEMSFPLAARTE
jgi:hypothetical protein